MTDAAEQTADDEPQPLAKTLQRVGETIAKTARDRENVSPFVYDEGLTEDTIADLESNRLEAWCRLIPSKFLGAELVDFDHETEPTRARLAEWNERPASRNLIIGGPVGVGKSRCSVAAVRAHHFRGLSVAFWPVDELINETKPSGTVGALETFVTVDRLIIDDLGEQYETDWGANRLSVIINRRWLDELPTIVTTNLDKDALEDRMGERTYSRLVDNAVGIKLTGRDRRRAR